jgi:flagellar basal body-associated protein FliL
MLTVLLMNAFVSWANEGGGEASSPFFKFKNPVVTNIKNSKNPSTAAYLKVELEVQLEDAHGTEELKKIEIPLLNDLIDLASQENDQSLSTAEGNLAFRKACLAKFNERIDKAIHEEEHRPKIKEILVTNFMVQ